MPQLKTMVIKSTSQHENNIGIRLYSFWYKVEKKVRFCVVYNYSYIQVHLKILKGISSPLNIGSYMTAMDDNG